MVKRFCVYIMTNKSNTTLYTGMSSDLRKRVYQHRNRMLNGFSRMYNTTKLVYFEVLEDPWNAIRREKQIKAGSRQKKIDLVNSSNPQWRDLYDEL